MLVAFLPSCAHPFKTAEAKLGIPARFDSDAFECFGTERGGGVEENGDFVSL